MHEQIQANRRRSWFIFAGLILAFASSSLAVGFWVDIYYGIFLAVLSIILVLYFYFSAMKKMVRMTKAIKVSKRTHRKLYLVVENLSLTAGLPTPDIYVINSQAYNAFAAGYKPEKSFIGVTSALLRDFDKRELEAVMAHEMSHIINQDAKIATLVFAFGVSAVFMFEALLRGGPLRGRSDGRIIFAWLAILAVAVVALILITLLKKSLSRQREYLADASGCRLTAHPEGMASALQKIADNDPVSQNMELPSSVSHLFLDRGRSKSRFLDKLLSTHPPIEDRIARVNALKTKGL